ncbi:hypothetical protein CMQ_8136 [Grosmannia clavigera kw1407]|uniref:Uncharacterized protein n=1 Tax=Grosmannia clavigera (strain kw1407 / UAMH 11150) TaxID=655863 RepID=F0XKR2_GROCL|nr:uncharacterized protein CMQ_8136 [Grosmannia clavigera kw1407]EFX01670.1 hypothetical protein CMQ_8136 [Grosmannia clavigera kw1407]
MAQLSSHGRGGAGNIVDSSKSPKLQPKDLETPMLKTSIVTTGRGGTGNMARNTDPKETRARQDVEPVTRRPSIGAAHVGRGGTGNVFKAEEVAAAEDGSAIADDKSSTHSDERKKQHQHSHSHSNNGLAAKGKDWLLGKRA